MRRKPPLDYLEDVYLFHCVLSRGIKCTWHQSCSDGRINCYQPGEVGGCAFPIPKPKRLICVGVRKDSQKSELFRPYKEPMLGSFASLDRDYGHIYSYITRCKTIKEAETVINLLKAKGVIL